MWTANALRAADVGVLFTFLIDWKVKEASDISRIPELCSDGNYFYQNTMVSPLNLDYTEFQNKKKSKQAEAKRISLYIL